MVSVCMATYNGERFIREQIESILAQIGSDDELIISDDGSTDSTMEIINSFGDVRIKVFSNTKNHGPVGNFENSLSQAMGDYIFLSDQDDIWLPGKVESSLALLSQEGVDCVICNRIIIDKDGNTDRRPVVKIDFSNDSFLKVLYHNPYMGCCMSFSKSLLKLALPFPEKLPMHDLWIGLLAHKMKSVRFLSQPYIGYRRHGNNVTIGRSPYSIIERIRFRLRIVQQLRKRLKSIH